MTLTPEDLALIEARVKSTTEGPWNHDPAGKENNSGYTIRGSGIMIQVLSDDYKQSVVDCSFIAHARKDIPALIAALKEAWAELAGEKP